MLRLIWAKSSFFFQANADCRFTLKLIRDLRRRYSQMHRTDMYPKDSLIIWPVWAKGWVFLYEVSGSGLEPSYSHLIFRFRTCLEQDIPWDAGNYRVWIQSERRTWDDKNMEWNAPYRYVLRKQRSHLGNLAKCLSVCLRTRWFGVLLGARSSLKFRQLRIECGFEFWVLCSGFEFSSSHLTLEQVAPWHSGNYRVWIHSETRAWHDKNI